MKRRPETEIAAAAVAWLEADGWDVYQEVKGPAGNIADVVARKSVGASIKLCVVECKAAIGATVCIQALRWRHDADQVWVCVGQEPVDLDTRHFYKDWLRWKAIGLLVTVDCGESLRVRISEMAVERPRRSDALLERLRPEHKTYAVAGSPNGSVWSPFKDSAAKIRMYLSEHPGTGAADVVKALGKLHWANDASARSGILNGAARGFMAGVRVEQDGRRFKLYVREHIDPRILEDVPQEYLEAKVREANDRWAAGRVSGASSGGAGDEDAADKVAMALWVRAEILRARGVWCIR